MQITSLSPPDFGPAQVPDTDDDTIRATWEDVWENLKMATRIMKRDARPFVDAGKSVGTPDSTFTFSRGVTTRSPKFPELVLFPRGFVVNDTNTIVPSAFAHFKNEPPKEGYDKLEGLSDTDIWVGGGDSWVQSTTDEYKVMKALGLCEDEFASFAKEKLLRRSPRSLLLYAPAGYST
ncbi:hypothetical protein VdG1_03600 [Verticillium dahliae VDG1]|nr:hypothetical protein VdG1_03600 [Verticillium dahliae VDG1]